MSSGVRAPSSGRATDVKPIYLLADSRPLLWDRPITAEAIGARDGATLSAAYLGASNGDVAAFYELFTAAMARVGITRTLHVHAQPSRGECAFLDRADLVLLAGGDPSAGWRAFESSGLREQIERCYLAGAVILGTSAGAMQLGLGVHDGDEWIPTFGWVPRVIDVHDEKSGWSRLGRWIERRDDGALGLGIPSGGAVIFSPPATFECREFVGARGP